jgi:hypothetical protein
LQKASAPQEAQVLQEDETPAMQAVILEDAKRSAQRVSPAAQMGEGTYAETVVPPSRVFDLAKPEIKVCKRSYRITCTCLLLTNA